MEKSRAIELLKLAVPIKALTQQEYSDFVEAVNMAIDALKAQLSHEGATKDTISRQAALEKVRTMQTYKLFKNDDMLLVDKAEVQTELMMLPPVQPEVLACGNGELIAKPEPQWIPVSERLPEVHESGNFVSGIYMQSNPVLVYGTCEYEDNAQFHVVTYCDDLDGNTYWSTELDAITVSGVLAWMPLPEAYKPSK